MDIHDGAPLVPVVGQALVVADRIRPARRWILAAFTAEITRFGSAALQPSSRAAALEACRGLFTFPL